MISFLIFLTVVHIFAICFAKPFCVDRGGCLRSELCSSPEEATVPSLGLGTAGLQDHTKELVCVAVKDMGYRLLDTAQAVEWYDEAGLGEALAACANTSLLKDLIIVTKIHPRSYKCVPDMI